MGKLVLTIFLKNAVHFFYYMETIYVALSEKDYLKTQIKITANYNFAYKIQ